MNKMDDLNRRFDELRALSLQKDARIYGTGLLSKWHEFADMQFDRAKEFFIERLDDPRANWRAESVSLLGFHYKLDPDLLDRLRTLVVHDLDSGVRMKAAAVLGSQGQLPEKSLVQALKEDQDDLVREAAFMALLELAGVPVTVRNVELERAKRKDVVFSLDEAKRVLRQQGLLSPLSLLEELEGQ